MIRPGKIEEEAFHGLPGADLVVRGLQDLRAGVMSVEALLVQVAAPRLARLNISVPGRQSAVAAEHELYEALEKSHGRGAHSQYNALLRRMASFAHSLEREQIKKPG